MDTKPYSKSEEKRNYKHKTVAIGKLDLLIKGLKDPDVISQLEAIRKEIGKIQ